MQFMASKSILSIGLILFLGRPMYKEGTFVEAIALHPAPSFGYPLTTGQLI